jgi:hypothetical protein
MDFIKYMVRKHSNRYPKKDNLVQICPWKVNRTLLKWESPRN